MACNETGKKVDLSFKKDQLSESEQKGQIGKLITYIVSFIESGLSISKVAKNVKALYKMNDHVAKVEEFLDSLINTSHSRYEILKEVQDFHAKNCTGVMDFDLGSNIELTELPTSDLTEAEKIRIQILNAFKDQQRQTSNEMIEKMAKANAVAAAVQFIKLYMARKAISSATNVTEDKKKVDLIRTNLKRMEEMVNDFVNICDTQPDDKSIDRKMSKINALFTSTKGKINTIEMKIKGKVERIEVTADYSDVDVLSNTLTAVSQGFQLWSAFENLSSIAKWLGGLSVAMFTFFCAANVAVSQISQDKLKELRKDLREANNLRDKLDNLCQQAEDAVFKL